MPTLADALLNESAVRRRLLARDAALILAGSMVVAICAKLQGPQGPVPFTMQPFAVLLVGAVLGARRGGLAMIAYLLEGAAGLPVFAGPIAGLAYFAGPTTGYLLAFPMAAAAVGALCQRGLDRRFVTSAAAMAVGQAILLAGGFAWLAYFVGPKAALVEGVLKFLAGDVLKILLAAAALPTAWRLLGHRAAGGASGAA